MFDLGCPFLAAGSFIYRILLPAITTGAYYLLLLQELTTCYYYWMLPYPNRLPSVSSTA